jgi:hypothetical protein
MITEPLPRNGSDKIGYLTIVASQRLHTTIRHARFYGVIQLGQWYITAKAFHRPPSQIHAEVTIYAQRQEDLWWWMYMSRYS